MVSSSDKSMQLSHHSQLDDDQLRPKQAGNCKYETLILITIAFAIKASQEAMPPTSQPYQWISLENS
jgi:hypothetical protein